MITVTTCAYDSGDLAFSPDDSSDCVKHIHEGIRGMRVVYDRSDTLRRAERLEASCHGDESAHVDKHFLFIPSDKYRCAVDCCEVVGVEASGKRGFHFAAIEREQGAIKAHVENAATEIGIRTQ